MQFSASYLYDLQLVIHLNGEAPEIQGTTTLKHKSLYISHSMHMIHPSGTLRLFLEVMPHGELVPIVYAWVVSFSMHAVLILI